MFDVHLLLIIVLTAMDIADYMGDGLPTVGPSGLSHPHARLRGAVGRRGPGRARAGAGAPTP